MLEEVCPGIQPEECEEQMNITLEEIRFLMNTKNEKEWNETCSVIKRARDDRYPPDWWPVIMQSGLAADIMSRWNEPPIAGVKVSYD